jgi:type I restriction enzyme S subunit
MSELKKYFLKDVLEVLTDYHSNGSYESLKANVELLDNPDYAIMIRATDFEKNEFSKGIKYISQKAYEHLSKSKVYPNDILMTKIANAGTMYLMPNLNKPVSLGMNLFLLRADPAICDPTYLYYYLKCHEKRMKGFANGATTTTITKQSVRDFEIELPSKLTQKRVSSILNSLNLLVEINEKKIKILEEMSQRIYREWFVDFKFPGYEKVKMTDSGHSDLGSIPEGCFLKTLGEIVRIRKGKNITRNTVCRGKVPVVAGGLEPAYYHNVANTVSPVITVSASGANAGYVNFYGEDVWASDCSVIDASVTSTPHYFYLLLKDKQRDITRLQRGSAQPHVYPKDLEALEIICFPEEIISKFDIVVGSIFNLIFNLRSQNITLTNMTNLLLPKLLS